ncbi:hypothetical protein HYT23_00140 [Candidatus Pacearchaeota archaeon]|nr:hypothetical protein [Candidatus Pacearchaeota archaeon]
MKKGGVVFLVLFLTLLAFVSADESSDVQDGYNCLLSKINSQNCAFATTEQKAFSLLALDDNAICKTKLLADKKNDLCWGKTSSLGCDIKTTAQAILALYKEGEDVSKQADWLYSQQMVPEGIDWFLQIESSDPVTCTVTPYDLSPITISIGADKKISAGNLGSCFTFGQQNYWLQINRACYNKEFQIQCDSGFLTNLLYKEGSSPTIFVSSETHSAAKDGKTFENIKSLCFKQGTSCDYEGGLWSAMVLGYISPNYNIAPFVPYLQAGSTKTENEKYLPAAFLYSITASNDFYLQILGHKNFFFNEYWSVSGDKYYDTALAVYTLEQGASQKTKDWFRKMQTKSGADKGCWREGDTIRNTAFVLHSVWPESAPVSPECTNNQTCVSLYNSSYYCSADGNCLRKPQPECTSNAWCQSNYGSNYICSPQGNCVLQQPQCSASNPCPNTQDCVDGVCVPKNITQQGCTSSTQCVALFGANWICLQNGTCARQPTQPPRCGDGNIDLTLNETCDGANWGAITSCSSLQQGFNNGTLSCYSSGASKQCTFNTTGCFTSPRDECNSTKPCPSGMQCNLATNRCAPINATSLCGNGQVDPGEDCDGTVKNITCSYFSYDGGTISCYPKNSSNACKFDVSQCRKDSVECLLNKECVAVYGAGFICGADNKCKKEGAALKCVDSGFFCRSREGCRLDSGNEKSGYSCPGTFVCCDEDLTTDNSCSGMNGDICESNEFCQDGLIISADNLTSSQVCCVGGTCEKSGTGGSYTDCEWYVSGTCKSSCDSTIEEKVSQGCEDGSSDVCCISKSTPACTSNSGCTDGRICKDGKCIREKKGSYLWLWILLTLIILAVIGIILRERLRPLIMKLKSMLPGSKRDMPRRPGFPPMPGMMSQPQMRPMPSRPRSILPSQGRSMPQPPMSRVPRPQPPQPLSREPPKKPEIKKQEKPKEKGGELDDVLKKLKEIGK